MKKFLTGLKYLVYGILLVIVASVSWFLISNKIFIGSEDQSFLKYLEKHNLVVGTKINPKFFDVAFYESDVFLLGEVHGYADNQKLDRYFLEFLNQKLAVRYYVAEMDSNTAEKLNRYLSAAVPNEPLLKEVVNLVRKRIPQQSSQELFDKWVQLHGYNQKLADSLKISVIGVDTDFDDTSHQISRDSAMIVNFKDAVKKRHLENEKFYGFFGFFHTLQGSLQNADKPFAHRLKLAGFKTTSLVSLPLDSEMYLPDNEQFPTPPEQKIDWVNADGPMVLVKGINDLKALSQANSITLFKLDGKESPYKKSQKLIHIKSRLFGDNIEPTENSTTTDQFQYVFITRNSKALSGLE